LSRIDSLKSLEKLLVSFLEQVVSVNEERLDMLSGINRLDEIARNSDLDHNLTDEIGNWFAGHNSWLEGDQLKPTDRDRVGRILGRVGQEIDASGDQSPAARKISDEIKRWIAITGDGSGKIVLTRGAEIASDQQDEDSITRFQRQWERLSLLLADCCGGKKHLMSALDDALQSATLQENREALLLSAFMIYYLKQEGYKVEPYVRRLKKAESLRHGGTPNV
jgi:hypothetical protein